MGELTDCDRALEVTRKALRILDRKLDAPGEDTLTVIAAATTTAVNLYYLSRLKDGTLPTHVEVNITFDD